MQFGSAGIVRVTAGHDAVSAGTAAAGGKIGVGKPDRSLCQKVNVGSGNKWVAITPEVIPTDIIGDKYDKIWLVLTRQTGLK